MTLPAFLRTPWAIAALVALLVFLASAALSTCGTRQAGELSGKQRRAAEAATAAARRQASRDSALAALHTDSAAFYRRRQHEIPPTSAADTASLLRTFTNYFGW